MRSSVLRPIASALYSDHKDTLGGVFSPRASKLDSPPAIKILFPLRSQFSSWRRAKGGG